MRSVEQALLRLGDSDTPLVRVLDATGAVQVSFSYRQLTRAAQALADQLTGAPRVGLICANTPGFVVADLALLAARAVQVPVPLAFTAEQAAGLLADIDVCLVDSAGARQLTLWGSQVLPSDCLVVAVNIDELLVNGDRPIEFPDTDGDWICKTIHTSGTTSQPKGVRIRAHGLAALLDSLRSEMPVGAFTRYLSTVPLSLLIEQVTGLYMVVLDGGTLTLLPETLPLVGTNANASHQVLPFLAAATPTALVATPVLVDEIAATASALAATGKPVIPTIFGTETAPLICCGGAPIHPDLLRLLDGHGIAVYEGYGLSENSSVVAWNTPKARRIGSVGRPLPHVRVRLAEDGELLVASTSLFAGYTRDDPSSCLVEDGWLRTGDLAEVDAEGFIRITGRKKNVIITAAGRNIAPEWVEAQYAQLPFVRAVAVVGDGLSALHGLFLVDPGTRDREARAAIDAFGSGRLSQVERVEVIHLRPAGEDTYRAFFTVTGRPVRHAIRQAITEGALDALKGAPGMSEEVRVQSYGTGTGRLVVAGDGQTLRDLDPQWVISLLTEAGFLLFRGFQPGLEDFSVFVKEHSSRVTLDPARSFHGGDVAQKVDAGVAAVGLHLENGNSPFGPDLTWFLCEKAAASGSQTTVCDGYRVWDQTSAATRQAFEDQDIVYSRRVEQAKWKSFVHHHSGGTMPVEQITVDDILRLANDRDSTTITANPDGSIDYAYRTPAAHTTLFGSRLAWANSIFGPSYNYETPRITFADGSDLPESVVAEMRELTDELTEKVQWCDGDVALIDNTRVMHGRLAIEDTARTIYNAQSYLKSELR